MRALQGWQDSFTGRHGIESSQGIAILTGRVLDPACSFPVTVFRTDPWVIEPCRDRMNIARLPVVILHDVAVAAVQDAWVSIG